MFDIPTNVQANVKEFITHFRQKLPAYDQLMTNNIIFRNRTEGVGILTKKDAISYGVTGPSGRASGWSNDVRKSNPYSAYDRVDFKEIIYTEGDSFARYQARIQEM